jgi:hypothetical protein
MNLYAQLVNNISMIIYLVCKLLTIVVYDIFVYLSFLEISTQFCYFRDCSLLDVGEHMT